MQATIRGIYAGGGASLIAISFVIWGIIPLYFARVVESSVLELLVFRLSFGVLTMWLLSRMSKECNVLKRIVNNPRSFFLSLCMSMTYLISWMSFIWAITNGYVLQASLAFFMTPIFNILFGVVFFKERLTFRQCVATFLVLIGLLYMIAMRGSLPWIALMTSSTFALYSFIRKLIVAGDSNFGSLWFEACIQLLLIVMFLFFSGNFDLFYNYRINDFVWNLLGAFLTQVPLVLFCLGLPHTPLNQVAFLQYIEPTLAFFIGYFFLKEILDFTTLIAFLFVWAAIIVLVVPRLNKKVAIKK